MSDYVKNEPNIKRLKHNEEEEQEVDHISEMPDDILIDILSKVITKDAVHTCILSKRWKNIWKSIPILVATAKHFNRAEFFKRFVYMVLVNRDPKIHLTYVEFEHNGYVRASHVDKIINYALSHDVKKLKVNCYINREMTSFLLFNGSSKFHSNTITYLDLSFQHSYCATLLPIKVEFPELIECRLRNVTIQPMEKNDDDDEYCAEPFSGCKKMTTLSIKDCAILKDAKCLIVVGDKLTNVTIWYQIHWSSTFRVKMRTPKLTSFTYVRPIIRGHSLEFEHDLNFLQDVTMEVCCHPRNYGVFALSLCSWLKKFTNAHSLTLSSATLKILSRVAGSPNAQCLNLSNIRTLTIKLDPKVLCEVPSNVINYLLQQAPTTAIYISTGLPSYYEDMKFVMSDYNELVLRYDMNNPVARNVNFPMWGGAQ